MLQHEADSSNTATLVEPMALKPPFLMGGASESLGNSAEEDLMHRIVQADNLRFVQKLIERSRNGEEVGYGPCHFAASLGDVELLELLLANGADMNERDKEGNCPLMWIVANDGDEELMEALVDQGASVNIQNFVGESPLFLAVQRNFEEKVRYLLENGADVRMVNLEGASPLHAAAAAGNVEIISLLVKYGAHVNEVDDEGDSPLHWAVREGQMEAASMLVKLGAEVNLKNEDGESPLDLAVCLEDADMRGHLVIAAGNRQGGSASAERAMPQLAEGNAVFAEEPARFVLGGFNSMASEELQRAFGKQVAAGPMGPWSFAF